MAPLVPFGFRLWWERVGQSWSGIREPQEILFLLHLFSRYVCSELAMQYLILIRDVRYLIL